MCRFLLYKGKDPILISHLLTRPNHSIIKQSFDAKLRLEGSINGDGFGIGFYSSHVCLKHEPILEPATFTSILPAWNNRNLIKLSEIIYSSLVFAHVRAASPGFATSESNCHPFTYGRFMFMHNGCIGEFNLIKRRLQQELRPELFSSLEGTTDSENVFMLFLNQFDNPMDMAARSPQILREMLEKTIRLINMWSDEAGITEVSLMNFAVTDGESIVCTRYANIAGVDPVSLCFSSGSSFEPVGVDGSYRMLKTNLIEDVVVIASEPLTVDVQDWLPVPPNHVIIISPSRSVLMYPIRDGKINSLS